MSSRPIGFALLLLATGVAFAQQPPALEHYRPEFKSYAGHLQDLARHRRHLPGRAVFAALHALAVRPAGWEAYLALAELLPEHRALLAREAYRIHPQREVIAERVAALIGTLPELRRWGRASAIVAFYAGRSAFDNGGRRYAASLDLGEAIDRRRLVVHGLDDAGNLVPVDVAYEAGEGLEIDDAARDGTPRIVGRAPSAAARLVLRDRKSGLEAVLTLRVIGPPAAVRPVMSRTQDVVPSFASDEYRHMRVRVMDAAGNALWRSRLLWTVEGAAGEPLGHLLARGYSWMHFDESFEAHVNTLRPRPDEPYAGPVTVRCLEPESGVSGTLVLERRREPSGQAARTVPGIDWQPSLEAAQEEARRRGTLLVVYYHATW